MRPLAFLFLFLFFSMFGSSTLRAGDWPQFLGPQRDSAAAADERPVTGAADPEPAWERKLGTGYAGPVVAGGRVILFHRQHADMVAEALDAADGKAVWKHTYPATYTDSFGFDDGPRATPCVADGKVILHGPEGVVQALDFETGAPLWSYDTARELASPQGFFGRACSVLVSGGRVLLNVGGRNEQGGAGIIALDLKTGKLVWQATDDAAGYASPILVPEDPGVAAFFTRRGIVLLQAEDGKVVADEPFRSDMDASVNAATPVACGGGRLLFSAAYDVGAGLWRWDKQKRTLQNLWKKHDALDCHYTTPVCHQGHVYGLHGRQESGMQLRCMEAATGRITWEAPDSLRGGTLVRVGETLLLHSEDGELWIFKAEPEKFDLIRRSQLTRAGHRSHPAFSNGMLYARDAEKMVAVKVK